MIPTRRIRSICLFAWLAVPLAAETASLDRHPSGKKTNREQYARLCERFESGDTTLTSDQYATVYYGFAAQSRYNGSLGYGDPDRTGQAAGGVRAVRADSEQSARVASGTQTLLLAAGRAAIPPEQALRYAIRFDGLLDAVFRSGDGHSIQTAFRVLSVADEYVVMQALGVESMLSQSLIEKHEKHYDRIEISGATGYEGDEIYFDVSLPMKHLDKVFGKK